MLKELEYKEQINKALENKNYDQVVFLAIGMVDSAYMNIAKSLSLPDGEKYDAPKEKVFEYFSEHDFSPYLTKKGIAALHLGDLFLAGTTLGDAMQCLPQNSHYAEPYFCLAFINALEGREDEASKILSLGLRQDPKLLDKFDALYNSYLSDVVKAEFKEKFRVLCNLLIK